MNKEDLSYELPVLPWDPITGKAIVRVPTDANLRTFRRNLEVHRRNLLSDFDDPPRPYCPDTGYTFPTDPVTILLELAENDAILGNGDLMEGRFAELRRLGRDDPNRRSVYDAVVQLRRLYRQVGIPRQYAQALEDGRAAVEERDSTSLDKALGQLWKFTNDPVEMEKLEKELIDKL